MEKVAITGQENEELVKNTEDKAEETETPVKKRKLEEEHLEEEEKPAVEMSPKGQDGKACGLEHEKCSDASTCGCREYFFFFFF